MKILQLVTKRQYRGAEVFAANLSKELLDLGHTIIFAGLYEHGTNILEVKGADNIDLSKRKKSGFSIGLLKSLISLIKATKPDIIQCNGSDTLKYMIAAKPFTGNIPVVYRNISTISEWLGSDLKLFLYRRLFKKVDHVTSVGSESINDLIQTLNYPRDHTTVIRRGIPDRKMDAGINGQRLRNELGLGKDSKIIMHVGNFSPEKNHIFLLDIFEIIKSTNPEIKLICAGDGITFDTIQNEIKRRELEDSIYLLGFRSDIPNLLAAADCIVLSSLVEGVPGVILEAAVQETPAVASNVGGVKEVLFNERTGYILDEFKPGIFAEKIIQISTDEHLRRELGINARNLVLNQFNPLKNAKKFEELYSEVIAGKSSFAVSGKQNLKVLQVIQRQQYRGAEIFCCQLSNYLMDSCHEVEIYSVFGGNAELPFKKKVNSLGGNEKSRYFDFRGWYALNKVIREFKPDIVQANAADTLKYTVFSKKIFKWKQPILYRNASIFSYYVKNPFSHKINKFLLNNVDSIVSVCNYSKIDLCNLYNLPEDKMEIIPVGINPLKTGKKFKAYFNKDHHNIVHIGSLTREKNHFGLLKIFQLILEEDQNARLHIFGEGNLKKEILSKIENMGLSGYVKFHGEVKHPVYPMMDADVFVLPSLTEGLPGVILEAMYFKVPVVAYDVGGIPEIVNSRTGVLINRNDEKAFAAGVLHVLHKRPEDKINNAYKLVKQEYINEEIARKFTSTYYKLLEGK